MLKIITTFAAFFLFSTSKVGKFTEYKVPLKGMPVGTQHIEYHLGKTFFTNMESADIHDADLHVDLDVVHKADIYDITFTVRGTVTLICDRCLDDMEYPIEASYHIAVKYGPDYNDDSDDLLIIPEGDNYLNVAYMIYDTVALSIPIKHVHPLGKCNRQMSAMLKKHRARRQDDSDEDAALEEELIEEMDSMPASSDDGANDDASSSASDPRWDGLKKLIQDE